MDEHQHYMKFGLEEDYDEGQWIGGEYFYSKKKEKRKQTREDVLYGVFNESDSEEEGGKRRRKDGGLISKGDLTKPVSFVSKGNVVPTEELNKMTDDEVKQEAERPGLGSGLGFGGAGLGFSSLGTIGTTADKDEADDILNTAFGQRIKEKAEKRKEQEKEKEKEKAKQGSGAKAKGPKGDIGAFEKYTKGFGLKMLEKMGYKGGGLGKDQQGIAVPVEAKMRPKMMGMGFNDFKEREAGLPPPPGMETEGDGERVKEERQAPKEKLWKKKHAGKKKEYRTAAQLLEERQAEGREVTQKIIDMRGAQVRVLTNLDHMNVDTSAAADDTPMPELQHNLRLIVDLAEADIQMTDRKLRQERDSLVLLQRERDRAKDEAARQKQQLDTLEAIVEAMDNIQANVNAHGATLDMLGEAFQSLRRRFKDEFKMYNLPALGLSYAVPVMAVHFRGWNPLVAPHHGVEAMTTWKSLLARDDHPREYSIFPEMELEASQDPYTQLVKEVVLPVLRILVTNSWEARNPEPLLRFLEAWEGLLPQPVLVHILEHLVMPKLTTAVDTWDPLKEPIPIHAWVHPWLPLLGARLEPLYQPIRYKLGKVLGGFMVGDPTVLAMLAPWQRVFDPSSWENLLVRFILPRLGEALQGFVVNPRNQELEVWNAVMAWAGAVPAQHMVALLEAGFFPQWQQVLYHWLCANPNFEEVTRWYLGWKAMLPPDLLANERIRHQLNVALDMMNQAVEGTPVMQPGARENVTYLRVTEQQEFVAQQQQQHMGYGMAGQSQAPTPAHQGVHVPRARPPAGGPTPPAGGMESAFAAGEGEDLSLKEVVGGFAEQHNVQFLPKAGRTHEGLGVYSFGAVSVCVDSAKQLLLAQTEGRWAPVSLEQLLELHRSRGGRWG